MRFKYF